VTSLVWRHRATLYTWRHQWRHQSTRYKHFPTRFLLHTNP